VSNNIEDEKRFREERAESLRERDREREPRDLRLFRRLRRNLAGRDAFQVGLAERAAEAPAADSEPATGAEVPVAHKGRTP
jgi:hypothetical protein